MKKMKNIENKKPLYNLNHYRHTDDGFSLIEVVVSVAITIALLIGGFVAYSGLINSAREAAENSKKTILIEEEKIPNQDEDQPYRR